MIPERIGELAWFAIVSTDFSFHLLSRFPYLMNSGDASRWADQSLGTNAVFTRANARTVPFWRMRCWQVVNLIFRIPWWRSPKPVWRR